MYLHLILFFMFSLQLSGNDIGEKTSRSKENKAFKVGEKLTFTIGYEFIPAGKTILRVEKIATIKGKKAYHISSRTKSHRLFDPFFKVRDEIDTYMDSSTFRSIKFRKKLREGRYSYDYTVEFDSDKMQAVSITSKGSRTFDIPDFTLDILSAMYYMRTLNLEVGKTQTVNVLDNDKLYPLDLKIIRKERVEVRAGLFDCLLVEPMLKSGGLFKNEGKISVWVTDDHRKIPVLIKSRAIIGSIVVELERVEGLIE